ncbi:MAG: M67 family metallopeptidase [Moritella sp.]|uniref:M67 family metallopeptidase n=1 Tax=Moritella sp. TaxID=78556 RepID=UPI0025E914DA|nr:M67 family metallopeptidase [Moritella sp.]NQZ91207.1 M67 family metallopeptidase [Moritella sp.]
MTIEINDAIKSAMLDQAESCFPNESCGFIIGSYAAGVAKGDYYIPCDNDHGHNQQRRFLIDPMAYQLAEDTADANGQSIISIVHSHPDHPDQPSEFDRLHAWPGLSYIIIAVFAGRVRSYRSWQLSDDRSEFHQEVINPGD